MVTRRVQEATETNTYITAIAQIVSKENPTAQNFPEHVSLSFILKQTGFWFLFMSAGLASSVPSLSEKKKRKKIWPPENVQIQTLIFSLGCYSSMFSHADVKKKKTVSVAGELLWKVFLSVDAGRVVAVQIPADAADLLLHAGELRQHLFQVVHGQSLQVDVGAGSDRGPTGHVV